MAVPGNIAFLEKTVPDRDKLPGIVEGHRQTFEAAYLPRTASGQVKRVARRFGLVAAAGELATEYGLTGWPKGEATRGAGKCFLAWLDSWGHGPKEEETLLRQVRAYIELHGDSRFTMMRETLHGDDPEPVDQRTINRVGFRQDTGGGVEYFILQAGFREIVKGYDSKRAAAILAARGILKKDGAGKNQISKTLPGMGKVRCYHVLPALWQDGQQADTTPDDEPEFDEADLFQDAA